MKDPCSGCALTVGAAANREPSNVLKAELCVLGGMPFLCHDGQDWKDPASHQQTRREAIRKGYRVCAGWARRAKEHGQAGYYRSDIDEKRRIAGEGMQLLDALSHEEGEEKEETLEELRSILFSFSHERSKLGIDTTIPIENKECDL